MTDYIEEMMKNAGVKEQYYSFNSADGNICTWELDEDGDEKYNMCFIGKPEIKQRLFTAEKQLKIENLIINHKFPVYDFEQKKDIAQYTPFGYFIENNKIFCCAGASSSFKKCEAESRIQAFARLITELMNAGELDKEKVKEILRG